jgi:hypothetical protein
VPVLVNTSFNTRGEPIVCTPRDAIESYLTSPLDALVIGSFLLEKASGGPCRAVSFASRRPITRRTPYLPTISMGILCLGPEANISAVIGRCTPALVRRFTAGPGANFAGDWHGLLRALPHHT